MNNIRKNNNEIVFPYGFPKLVNNGDYHIIHSNDNMLRIPNIKQDKIDQLLLWLKNTFQYMNNDQDISNLSKNIKKAYNIYNSDKRNDFIEIIEWLNSEIDD